MQVFSRGHLVGRKAPQGFVSTVFVWYCRLGARCHCTSVFQHGSPWNIFVVGLSSLLYTICHCMGYHGWVAGIASQWSFKLSRDWLVTIEIPRYHRHPYLPYSMMQNFVKLNLSNPLFEIHPNLLHHKPSWLVLLRFIIFSLFLFSLLVRKALFTGFLPLTL